MPKVTIQEIARKAGVSTATVSRVLSKTGQVSEDTEKRVLQAAQDLNFAIPNAGWKSRTGVHHRIGMLIAGIENGLQGNSFFAEVVAGASSEAERRDLSFSIAPLSNDKNALPAMIRYGAIDGLIVAGVPIPDEQILALSQLPIPTVFIGRYLDNYPLSYVSPENLEGGREAAALLKELGHRKFLILSGPDSIKTFKDRLRGVQEILNDPTILVDMITCENFDEADGYQSVSARIKQGEPFSAIVALTDWMAFGALRALQEHGMRVPQDVSIIGFSDLPMASAVEPALTTIHIPQRYLGALAVHLAHALIDSDILAPTGMMVPLTLIQRSTTAPFRDEANA
jgi:LacI family transcriptional regulator